MNQRYILVTDYASNPHTVVVDELTGKRVSIRRLVEAMNVLEEMARDDFDFEKWNNRVVEILGLDE